MLTLGQRLKMLRNTHNMKQSELAEAMYVSKFTVSAWERDLQKPEYNKLESLSRLFNVNLSYLLGENDDSSPPVPDLGEEAIWADDDVEAMQNAAKMLTQLSFSSRMIIRASILQAYQIEKDAGTLRKGYEVTMTRYGGVDEESADEEPVEGEQSAPESDEP